MAKTSEVATDLHGNKLYQRRAREALPILVRQAEAGKPIYYADLAEEMGMPNPRNLNFPLGCIGDALNALAEKWGKEVPHIQSIVVNQSTNSPGPGFDSFLKDQGYKWANTRERRALFEEYRAKVSAYPYWSEVLQELGVSRSRQDVSATIEKAARMGGGGEGPEHKALKEFVRTHPASAGLAIDHPQGVSEHPLPSGDSVDVFFERGANWTAVEVKPDQCGDADVARGLFQCVKYRAVILAEARYRQKPIAIAAKLVLGGKFPASLIPLRNSLGVEVIEGVRPL